ncbi:MAG: rod-binding protein [Limisphaerales bacterium]
MDITALQAPHVKAEDIALDRLASNPRLSEPEKITAASHAFEALLLRQVLQEAQRPVFQSKYANDSTTHGIYRDMVVEQLADSIAKSNSLGLAQSLAKGLQRQFRSPSTAAATGGEGHDPITPGTPATAGSNPLRSPKDAADHPLTPPAQTAGTSPATLTPADAELVSGPSAARILNSPKMMDLSDRKLQVPVAVSAKNNVP